MPEDENIALKNKIGEMKERLQQIYSQTALDANKSKAFENEFSLYLKGCEHARDERREGIRLQYDVTKFGLAVLTVLLAFTGYAFSLHILPGMLLLLGFGVVSCGCMYLLLAGELRIMRAGDFCSELEAFFRQHRWATELNEALNLTKFPLWEEYRNSWDKDLFAEGPFRKTAVFAPFRLAITLADLLAAAYLLFFFISHKAELSWTMMIASCIAWGTVVLIQMLLVHAIINTADTGPGTGRERHDRYHRTEITWDPFTWIILLRLFLILDILFPRRAKKTLR